MPASKKHVKKATPPKESVVEATPAPEVVESAPVTVEAPTESLGDEFAELLSTLNTLKSTVTSFVYPCSSTSKAN